MASGTIKFFQKLFLWIPFAILFVIAGCKTNKGTLSSEENKIVVNQSLDSHAEYLPFPKIEDRVGWAKANQELLKANLIDAEELLDYNWPTIPATYALLPSTTGNRVPYQNLLTSKSSNLWKLTMAEIHENKGRFINQIVDGIWSICEDSYWGHTTHLNLWRTGPGLPNVEDPFVDIYASEVASVLSWVSYFMEGKLDSISPLIYKRIHFEVNERIFEPFMNQHHYWMAASEFEPRPNNWNPWICANILNAVLLLEQKDEKREEMVIRVLEVLDEFFIPYPEDGCCDEGPHYWAGATGTFYEAVSILKKATGGKIDIYANEKFKNMGRYIWRVAIDDVHALNFSDSKPEIKYNGSLIYRYGCSINDPEMIKMGAYYLQKQGVSLNNGHLFNELSELFMSTDKLKYEGGITLPKEFYFPNTEVFLARDNEGSSKGYFVASKGGHNHESHNHNDLGNYIINYDGKPVIVDVGSGTYTARTFSPQRYDIWFNLSEFHNTPTINGVNQLNGANFQADSTFFHSKPFPKFSMNLLNAYPADTGIKSWKREIRLVREEFVELSNSFELSAIKNDSYENIMTLWVPKQISENRIGLFKNEADVESVFIIEFNPEKLEFENEKMALTNPEDKAIVNSWGQLYRIRFKLIDRKIKNSYTLKFYKNETNL